MRWSSQRFNQQQLRMERVPPQVSYKSRPHSVMSHYSDPSYVLGNSTTQDLERIARMLKFGETSEPVYAAEEYAAEEYAAELDNTIAFAPILGTDLSIPPEIESEVPDDNVAYELE